MSNNNITERAQKQSPISYSQYIIFKAEAPLQEIYDHPLCPLPIKNALSCETAWHKRNEYKVANGIRWSSHYTAALMACETVIVTDDKEESIEDFLNRQGAVSKIIEIKILADMNQRYFGEAHIRRTPSDNPLISAVASVIMEGDIVKKAILALTGVWEEGVHTAKSVELLINNPLTSESILRVAEAVKQEVNPKSNYLASSEYRREMAAVVTKRALSACLS